LQPNTDRSAKSRSGRPVAFARPVDFRVEQILGRSLLNAGSCQIVPTEDVPRFHSSAAGGNHFTSTTNRPETHIN